MDGNEPNNSGTENWDTREIKGYCWKVLMVQQVFGVTIYKSKTNNNCILYKNSI